VAPANPCEITNTTATTSLWRFILNKTGYTYRIRIMDYSPWQKSEGRNSRPSYPLFVQSVV
jgi:hypothetical protein